VVEVVGVVVTTVVVVERDEPGPDVAVVVGADVLVDEQPVRAAPERTTATTMNPRPESRTGAWLKS
jgi:hypothetical protein